MGRWWLGLAIGLLGCAADSDAAADTESLGAEESGSPQPGIPCEGAESREGEATYYDFADGSGNCSFDATPNDLMVGAMNQTDYAGSATCGSCVRIEGPDGTIDVRIVDRCPECPQGDIDLSPDAFAMIAPIEAGRVPISWEYVSCTVPGSLRYHFKDGSNEWWTAVQIRNHVNAIARFEVEIDGQFVEVPRLDYNYFVKDDGMGPGPYSFRVTDILGNVVEDQGVPLLDDAGADGSNQFPACGAESQVSGRGDQGVVISNPGPSGAPVTIGAKLASPSTCTLAKASM